jgi:small subunit ribosomal protein S16
MDSPGAVCLQQGSNQFSTTPVVAGRTIKIHSVSGVFSVAVVIRMKKMGKAHRQFFRICATDKRAPRDGRVLEELGTYDPHVSETDARVHLNQERVSYWLGVGAQPSEKVAILIKKYGPSGTHVDAQRTAFDRLAMKHDIPDPGAPASLPKSKEAPAPPVSSEAPAPEAAAPEAVASEAAAEEAAAPAEAAAE